jgi:phosphohistidine phosphatase
VKNLTLLRHAKSSWGDPGLADHERPLNKRGEQDAPRMGRRLLERRERPSLILTSTAVRARTTARLVADAIGYPREFLQSDRALYHADPGKILAVLAQQDDAFANVLLVGHNPGLTELANELLPDFDIDNLPTAGVVAMALDIDHWSEVGDARARLRFFDFPKNPLPADVPPDPQS